MAIDSIVAFEDQAQFERMASAVRFAELMMRGEQVLRPAALPSQIQKALVRITGPKNVYGVYPAVFTYRVYEATTSTTTTPTPSTTSTTSTTPAGTTTTTTTTINACSTTSTTTTRDPRYVDGDRCFVEEVNGDTLGKGCRFLGIVTSIIEGYGRVLVQSADKVGDCDPTAPVDQPCKGRCKYFWKESELKWELDTADYATNGCCNTAGCQCDEPNFCNPDGCAVVVTNCTAGEPVKQPNCKCINCSGCTCTVLVGSLVSGTTYNISQINCGILNAGNTIRTLCKSCGGCQTATTHNFGAPVTPGEYRTVPSLGNCSGVLGGTTTTSTTSGPTTTTTTTRPPGSCTGCRYKYVPLIGWSLQEKNCKDTKHCLDECALSPPSTAGGECSEFTTGCKPKPVIPVPPIPVCSGQCEWVSDGSKWVYVASRSRCSGGCVNGGSCACEPPSHSPANCGTTTVTGCKCPKSQVTTTPSPGTTTPFPSGGTTATPTTTTTTTTTIPPCTTTTVPPGCSTGSCYHKWNAETGTWIYQARTCSKVCSCSPPKGFGEFDCQVLTTPCRDADLTTTTTTTAAPTTTTTTTTTTLNCTSASCNVYVSSCAVVSGKSEYTLTKNCESANCSDSGRTAFGGCSGCSGSVVVTYPYDANCSFMTPGTCWLYGVGCDTITTTTTTTTTQAPACTTDASFGGGCGAIYGRFLANVGGGNCLWGIGHDGIGGGTGTDGYLGLCYAAGIYSSCGCCCTVDTPPTIVAGCSSNLAARTRIGGCVPRGVAPSYQNCTNPLCPVEE